MCSRRLRRYQPSNASHAAPGAVRPRPRAARPPWLTRARARQVMQAQMQDAAEDYADAASASASEALSSLGSAAADGAASAAQGLGQAVVDAGVAAAPVVLDGLRAAVPVVRLACRPPQAALAHR